MLSVTFEKEADGSLILSRPSAEPPHSREPCHFDASIYFTGISNGGLASAMDHSQRYRLLSDIAQMQCVLRCAAAK